MRSALSKSRRVLSVLLASLIGPLTASVLTVASASPAQADTAPVGGTVAGGYVLGASDGGVYNFGAHDFGSMGGKPLAKPIVGMATTPTGDGYWMVASDGGIFSFGDAAFHGSTGHIALNKPIVGMAATPTGEGYWFVAADGGIFAFGDAKFYGSTGNITLNQPIVGMASTPTGNGYWFVAADGGIFSFGDAAFKGSTGNITLAKPIVGMASTPSGGGYWMVASDGGIFSFGDARFFGSTGALTLAKPIVDMATTSTGEGYWLVAEDGGIFTFGNAAFKGSTGGTKLNGKIVDLLPQGGDITAPKLHALSFSPKSVDTSTGPATLDIQARITDDIAGVGGASIWFRSPGGTQVFSVPFDAANTTAGVPSDGVYTKSGALPAYSEQGTWHILRFSMNDRVGNRVDVDEAALAAAGYPTTFQQTGAGDTTAPRLQALSFSPRSVDTSTGPATFDIQARITDDIAGVGGASIWFRSPSGTQSFSVPFDGSNPISGDSTNSVYTKSGALPAYSEQGTWHVLRFSMNDKAGNRVDLDEAALAAAGYPTTFQQTGAGDTTAPRLQALSFSPRSVDTSTGPATFDIQARITDDVAGVGGASIWFRSPSGSQVFSVPFDGSNPVSGTPNDGVYEPGMPAVLPAYSEQGTWHLLRFSMNDKAGNRIDLDEATVAAAGYPTTFEVARTG